MFVVFFFNENNVIEYECIDSNYRFFSPEKCTGDGNFYEDIENHEWYYMPWKWENKIALKYITNTQKVLEIGAGKGDFIYNVLKIFDLDISGLELNKSAIEDAKKKGIYLINEKIEIFSERNKEKFNIVIAFQVLEHIFQVRAFISSCIDCLSPGGYLLFSVPNNDSFIKYDQHGPLNLPPHHMGLWNTKSLLYLEILFPLKVERIYYEPLAFYHIGWYLNIMEEKYLTTPAIRKLYNRSRIRKVFYLILLLFRRFIRGHTVLVVFQKT